MNSTIDLQMLGSKKKVVLIFYNHSKISLRLFRAQNQCDSANYWNFGKGERVADFKTMPKLIWAKNRITAKNIRAKNFNVKLTLQRHNNKDLDNSNAEDISD